MAGSLTVLSAHRFKRAKEELSTAELLLHNANFRSSINRSYYAIFHAIRAVNALDGFDSSKHSGVISHFNQEYVKTGIFQKRSQKLSETPLNCGNRQIMKISMKRHRKKPPMSLTRHPCLLPLWKNTCGISRSFELGALR